VAGHNKRATQTSAGDAQAGRRLLGEAIERGQHELLGDIGFYVWRFGLAKNREAIAECAKEVLQETAVVALDIADKYDSSRSARLWLLRIALIVIKRKFRERGRDRHRFTLVTDSEPVRRLVGDKKARQMSEAGLFDVLSRPPAGSTPPQSPTAEELLALVQGDDREILRLHYVEGFDGEELAAKFGMSREAVYQRLSRARIKLRRAYFGEEN
jgi:RNA polymerase sigma factor (sigma-70 family)